MKPSAPKQLRREIFVLTPEEKRTVCFILLAFLLGLATKHYRDTHSPSVSPIELVKSSVSAPAKDADSRTWKDRPAAAK